MIWTTHSRHFSRPLVFIVSLLLSACVTTHYEFIQPDSEQGKACVTGCTASRDSCREREFSRAHWEQMRCEQQNDLLMRRCLLTANSREEANRCGMYRQFCFGRDNSHYCEVDYRSCFVKCGGQIRTYEEDD